MHNIVMKFLDREEGGGNRRTSKTSIINNQTQNKIQAWFSLVFTVVTPPFILPKLRRGTRDRWVAQVSFIIIYSTDLAPFPRLSAPPHSLQTSSKDSEKLDKSQCVRDKAEDLCWMPVVFGPSDDTASLIGMILSLTLINGPRNTSRSHCR